MCLREWRAPLLDCRAYRVDCAGQVALLHQHSAKLELCVRIVAAPLVERLAKGSCSLFQVTELRVAYAEIVPGFRKLSSALLDSFVIRVDGFRVFASPRKGESERVIRIRIVGLLFDGSSQGVNRASDIARIQKRARELIVSSREVAAAHLYSHAITIDRFVEPSFVVKDQTFVEVLLRGMEGATHRNVSLREKFPRLSVELLRVDALSREEIARGILRDCDLRFCGTNHRSG